MMAGAEMSTQRKGGFADRVLNARITAKSLIYFQISYVLVALCLMSTFDLPGSALYVTDIVTLLAIICCPKGSWTKFRRLGNTTLLALFLVFCVVLFLGDIFHAVKPTLVIWGIRNTFRFFAFLYVCVSLLDKADIEKVFNLFFAFQVINVAVSLLQYSQGYSQDTLGGIFGTEVGCNGYINVFFCILLAYQTLAYVDGRQGLGKVSFIAVSTLVLAALAELKIYYIEAVIIILFAVLCRTNKVKSFAMLLMSVIAFFAALQVFSEVFPDAYRMLTNLDALIGYSSDSSGAVYGYNISRLNAFNDINNFFFHDDAALNLFGIGFGNAGYSSYSIFTSEFYCLYGGFNYFFFTHQNWFIETGYVGFGMLIALFALMFAYSGKWASRLTEDSFYFRLAQIVIVITVLCFWYNQTLRVEAAYLTFFVLSVPFLVVKSKASSEERRSWRELESGN